MAAESRWRRVLQFRLSTLLLLMLGVGVYLGEHHRGRDAAARANYAESFFIRVYHMPDLVTGLTPADREAYLVDLSHRLRTNVAPQSWTEAREPQAGVQPVASSGSLVVSQTGAVHDQVELFVHELRADALTRLGDEAQQILAGLPATSQGEPVVLVSYAPTEPLARGALEQQYADLVGSLAAKWGRPTFAGACTEAGFPAWSVAQSLSLWSRAGGQVYVALQDRPDVGLALLVGRRL